MMQPAPGRHDQHDRPRFRQDLVAEPIEEQGARFVDVMDPDSGNIFRFYEVEYSLACGMDGERDVPGIVKWAQDELGLTPSPQEVRTVIAALGDLGFIEAAGASELAPGVVVGAPPKQPTPADLGLGAPGAGAASTASGSAAAKSQPAAPAPDIALGASGASARRPLEPAEDVALGAPGRSPARPTPGPGPAPVSSSDVSLDLSDHIPVRRSDVQEAVRASKVMAAVDMPEDVLDVIEERPAPKAATFERPAELPRPPDARIEVRSDSRVEPRPDGRDARIEVKSDARVGKPPLTKPVVPPGGKPPVELPPPPAPVDQQASSAVSGARVSPLLIVLLVVAILGVAGFLVWKYVLEKPTVDTTAEPAPPAVQPLPPPPAPPPPPPPTAKIALEMPAPDDVTTTRAGVIETILAERSAVKAGDVVVKLVGDKPIEAELANLARDQKRLQDQIDAYTRRRDAARAAKNKAAEAAAQTEIDARQKTLATKQGLVATKTLDLDKFLLHAPSNGTFAAAVKLGQKVAANSVLARIQRDPTPVATFTLEAAPPFAASASVEVSIGKGEQHLTCTVADVQPTTVKVACPGDSGLAEGTEVTIKLPAPPDAAPGTATPETVTPETPPAAPPGEGSAAAPSEGSAAAPGEGSAAASPPPAKP